MDKGQIFDFLSLIHRQFQVTKWALASSTSPTAPFLFTFFFLLMLVLKSLHKYISSDFSWCIQFTQQKKWAEITGWNQLTPLCQTKGMGDALNSFTHFPKDGYFFTKTFLAVAPEWNVIQEKCIKKDFFFSSCRTFWAQSTIFYNEKWLIYATFAVLTSDHHFLYLLPTLPLSLSLHSEREVFAPFE